MLSGMRNLIRYLFWHTLFTTYSGLALYGAWMLYQ